MDGVPEGSERVSRRVPKPYLLAGVVFVGYLTFRLVQGVFWLVHKL